MAFLRIDSVRWTWTSNEGAPIEKRPKNGDILFIASERVTKDGKLTHYITMDKWDQEWLISTSWIDNGITYLERIGVCGECLGGVDRVDYLCSKCRENVHQSNN